MEWWSMRRGAQLRCTLSHSSLLRILSNVGVCESHIPAVQQVAVLVECACQQLNYLIN